MFPRVVPHIQTQSFHHHRPAGRLILPRPQLPPPLYNGVPIKFGNFTPQVIYPQLPARQDPIIFSLAHNSYIQIRRVDKYNFCQEFNNISFLIKNTQFHIVSVDTEYPGVIYTPSDTNYYRNPNPEGQYSLMKANVDELELIQVGLTLSDSQGNLATLPNNHNGLNIIVVWEFAISDFNLHTQRYNQASIDMLTSRGLDFHFHRTRGIHSVEFAKWLILSHLVASTKSIHWITFHGAYDFGYLIKALTRNKLPNTLAEFKTLVKFYFGENVYDIKHMSKFSRRRLFGGLEKHAEMVKVERILGEGHQAGSDSLLTQMVFQKIKANQYLTDEEMSKENIRGMIHPLTPYV